MYSKIHATNITSVIMTSTTLSFITIPIIVLIALTIIINYFISFFLSDLGSEDWGSFLLNILQLFPY